MSVIDSFNSYAISSKSAKMPQILSDLAKAHNCILKLFVAEVDVFKEKVTFDFTGLKQNILNLRADYVAHCGEINIKSKLGKEFKTNSFEDFETDTTYTAKINVDKKVDFLSLPQEVSNYLEVYCTASETPKGLFKGKDVTLSATGNQIELRAFKKLLRSLLSINDPKEMNNSSRKKTAFRR